MKRYAEYKDSGIEWIGEIPCEWETRAIKYTVSLKTDKMNLTEQKYIGLENVQSGTGRYIETGSQEIDGLSTSFGNGDVLFGKLRPYLAKCIIPTFDGICSSEFLILRNFDGVNKYLQYFLLSPKIVEAINASTYGVKMPRANWSFIGQMPIPMPSTLIQQSIVDYLDRKTAAIDTLIADKQKLVSLLQEKRSSIISEAVTKGLDKTAKMKDSGVEWIGKIPNNWILTKFKYFTSKIGSGKTPKGGNEVYADEGIVFVRSQNVHNTGLFLDDVAYITTDMDKDLANTRLELNDVLLNVTGASIGRSCIWKVEGIQGNVNQHVCIIRSNGNAIPPHIHYVLISNIGQTFIDSCQTGANRQGLNFEQIANFTLPLPKFEEQQTIVTYLDQKTTRIDALISDINEQIEKLKEYRQAIISEAVTGKVAV